VDVPEFGPEGVTTSPEVQVVSMAQIADFVEHGVTDAEVGSRQETF